LTAEEKNQLKTQLFRDTARLARRLEQDKLVDGPLQAQVAGAAKEEKSFQDMFKDAQKAKLDSYLKSLRAVSSHLESKLESVLKAKRLSAAQREQTPAQYRDMVNRYYEQLAKE
jgi:hypothetical protein